jgi:hypothetical protein
MNWALYVIAGWLVLGALMQVGTVGNQRKPTTPFQAAVIVAIDAAIAVALVIAARRLS